jgi:uncharacterized protein YwqG
MREMKITFSEVTDDLQYPKNLGKRSKLGGKPDWIQNDETPRCLHCKNDMEFVVQIDSIGYTGSALTTGECMFGDVGMIYVFFCKECGKTKAVFQEY